MFLDRFFPFIYIYSLIMVGRDILSKIADSYSSLSELDPAEKEASSLGEGAFSLPIDSTGNYNSGLSHKLEQIPPEAYRAGAKVVSGAADVVKNAREEKGYSGKALNYAGKAVGYPLRGISGAATVGSTVALRMGVPISVGIVAGVYTMVELLGVPGGADIGAYAGYMAGLLAGGALLIRRSNDPDKELPYGFRLGLRADEAITNVPKNLQKKLAICARDMRTKAQELEVAYERLDAP